MPKDKAWYFTFGSGVDNPHRNCYVVIKGTWTAARGEMQRRFGSAWCGQYTSAEDAGVKEFNLKEITS